MAAKKRTARKRQQDLAELAALDADGLTNRELAAHFKLSLAQIEYDLADLDRRFKKEQIGNVERRKRRRHSGLERIKRLALAAFERSKQDAETLHAETTKGRYDTNGQPLPDQVKTTKTLKGQAGDAALLEKALRAEVEQIRLWGDAAADRLDLTTGGQPLPPITAVEIVRPDASAQPDGDHP